MNEGRDVARAVDALRRGWPVSIDGNSFLAIETTDEAAELEAALRVEWLPRLYKQ